MLRYEQHPEINLGIITSLLWRGFPRLDIFPWTQWWELGWQTHWAMLTKLLSCLQASFVKENVEMGLLSTTIIVFSSSLFMSPFFYQQRSLHCSRRSWFIAELRIPHPLSVWHLRLSLYFPFSACHLQSGVFSILVKEHGIHFPWHCDLVYRRDGLTGVSESGSWQGSG